MGKEPVNPSPLLPKSQCSQLITYKGSKVVLEASDFKASDPKAGVSEDANALEANSKGADVAIVLQRRNPRLGLTRFLETTEILATNECLMAHSFSPRPSRGTAASD